jgi:DNA-binding NarL/FixJ family response regulator
MLGMGSAYPTSVFIVDDSDSIRQRLVSMLRAMQNVVVVGEARTESEAIDGIVATAPDIVLLDLNLGAGSGMQVLHAVRRKLPRVSVVVLTNHSEPQYRRACIKAGARHFFDKSTQFDCVRTVISDFDANPTGSAS